MILVLQIIPKEVLAYSLSCIRIRKSVLGNKQNNHMCVVLQSSSKERKEAVRGIVYVCYLKKKRTSHHGNIWTLLFLMSTL